MIRAYFPFPYFHKVLLWFSLMCRIGKIKKTEKWYILKILSKQSHYVNKTYAQHIMQGNIQWAPCSTNIEAYRTFSIPVDGPTSEVAHDHFVIVLPVHHILQILEIKIVDFLDLKCMKVVELLWWEFMKERFKEKNKN